MKRIALAALATTLLATAAHAQGKGGIGFRTSGVSVGSPGPTASPTLGIRHWLNERAGIDAAFGFTTLNAEAGPPTTQIAEGSGYAFDLGVPISAKKWDKVNLIVRPGFLYATANLKDSTDPTPPNEQTGTLMAFRGEIEVEWMAAEWLGISAAHGIAYVSNKIEDNASPANELKTTGFLSTGDNFTSLGFHVYLW
jgi:hypothetical protein